MPQKINPAKLVQQKPKRQNTDLQLNKYAISKNAPQKILSMPMGATYEERQAKQDLANKVERQRQSSLETKSKNTRSRTLEPISSKTRTEGSDQTSQSQTQSREFEPKIFDGKESSKLSLSKDRASSLPTQKSEDQMQFNKKLSVVSQPVIIGNDSSQIGNSKRATTTLRELSPGEIDFGKSKYRLKSLKKVVKEIAQSGNNKKSILIQEQNLIQGKKLTQDSDINHLKKNMHPSIVESNKQNLMGSLGRKKGKKKGTGKQIDTSKLGFFDKIKLYSQFQNQNSNKEQ